MLPTVNMRLPIPGYATYDSVDELRTLLNGVGKATLNIGLMAELVFEWDLNDVEPAEVPPLVAQFARNAVGSAWNTDAEAIIGVAFAVGIHWEEIAEWLRHHGWKVPDLDALIGAGAPA